MFVFTLQIIARSTFCVSVVYLASLVKKLDVVEFTELREFCMIGMSQAPFEQDPEDYDQERAQHKKNPNFKT